MRLVNLSRKDDNYIVKAQIQYKLFGMVFYTQTREFIKPDRGTEWFTLKGEKVSAEKVRFLNKWLSDHRRFIE